MSVSNIQELMAHVNHRLEIAWYGDKREPVSATIECLDCHEVLVEFNKEKPSESLRVADHLVCRCGHALEAHQDGSGGDHSGPCTQCGCSGCVVLEGPSLKCECCGLFTHVDELHTVKGGIGAIMCCGLCMASGSYARWLEEHK